MADYWGKVALAMTVTLTKTATDAIGLIQAAREQAEAWLGHPLVEEVVDAATGEVRQEDRIVLVSDNGGAFRSASFARFIDACPEFTHVRTRFRAPHTNGVVERTFQSFKYEHLYRRELADGVEIAREVEAYRHIFNAIRPHEHLHFQTPYSVWIHPPATAPGDPPDSQPERGESVSDS